MRDAFEAPVGKHLLAWLGMPLLAIANGVIRDTTYGRRIGEDAAHGLSTLPLLALIAGYTWLVARRWPLRTRAQALTVGAAGALFAVTFDLVFGRIEGKTWSELFRDYNVFAGRLWPLVPALLLIAPELHRRRQRNSDSTPSAVIPGDAAGRTPSA
mgnify:CR=1 FL=1